MRLLLACQDREGGNPPPRAVVAFPQRAYSDDTRFQLTALGEAYLDALQAQTPAA